jgi:glutamyl-tRNA reductase
VSVDPQLPGGTTLAALDVLSVEGAPE